MFLYIGKVFVITIRTGSIKVIKGNPPQKFISDCKQIIRKKVVRGKIYGVIEAGELRLEFSTSVPESLAQRFRNVFPYQPVKSLKPCGNDPRKIRKLK